MNQQHYVLSSSQWQAACNSRQAFLTLFSEPFLEFLQGFYLNSHEHPPRPTCHSTTRKHIAFEDTPLHLNAYLNAARTMLGNHSPNILLSQWSKYWFKTLFPGIILLISRYGCRLDLTSSQLHLDNGLPKHLIIETRNIQLNQTEFNSRYTPLFIDTLTPIIEQLSYATKLAPRVLWGNAAHVLEYLLATLIEQHPNHPQLTKDYQTLFQEKQWPNTPHRNPLYRAIYYQRPRQTPWLPPIMRTRKVCCLSNHINPNDLCSACPLLLTMDDQALENYHMQALTPQAQQTSS